MPKAREYRDGAPIITPDRDSKGFLARLVTYGPVDSYGTRWAPGVFTDSVNSYKPVLAWGHNWSEPIGRLDDYDDRADGPYGHFRIDAVPEVPRGLQAHYQLKSGTLTDVSVGIMREADEPNDDGTATITRAALDETSVVLRGAVPGAGVVAGTIRSMVRGGEFRGIALADVLDLAKRVTAGELSEEEAAQALTLLGGKALDATATGETPVESGHGNGTGQDSDTAGDDADDADVAEALAAAADYEAHRSARSRRW